MDHSELPYLSFLIRLWQVGRGEERVWRITVESPQTREHWNFTSLEALAAFLKANMEKSAGSERPLAPEIDHEK
jgi:hypothetical protein